MNTTTREPINLNSEELAVLAELLESERAKLLRTYGARCLLPRDPLLGFYGGLDPAARVFLKAGIETLQTRPRKRTRSPSDHDNGHRHCAATEAGIPCGVQRY
jgi:hypothetical protein